MKIAFLADTLDRQYAGIHIYTQHLIRALLDIDSQNEYYLVRPEAKGNFFPAQDIVKPIYPFPGHQSLRLFWGIPRSLSKMGMDVVVEPAHFGPFNLPKHIKRITLIHDLTTIKMPEYHVLHSQLLQRIFLPRILRKADKIIVNSNYTKSDLIDYAPFAADKTDVIYAGKDAIFRPKKDKSALKALGIDENYFLYVGTLEPRKNLNTLLQAYTQLRNSSEQSAQLVLVGKKAWKTKSLFRIYDSHPFKKDIVLTGYVDRNLLPVLMSHCLGFVYPSLYEGFGLPVLEAMACGAPVIVADNTSLREITGSAGLMFEALDVDLLSKYLYDVQQKAELRNTLKLKSLKQAEKYSWDRSAKLFLNSLHSITS